MRLVLCLLALVALAPPPPNAPLAPASDAAPAGLVAANAAATITITAQEQPVLPNDARRVAVRIATKQIPIWLVVVIVPLRSPIATSGDAGACEQATDARSGAADWLVCRFFNPPPTSTIAIGLTMLRPAGVVTRPIADGCRTWLAIGTPISVAVNGERLLDDTVWSPYRPAYCQFFPFTPGRSPAS